MTAAALLVYAVGFVSGLVSGWLLAYRHYAPKLAQMYVERARAHRLAFGLHNGRDGGQR